ncbi:MAG: signal peptidase I [Christensenellales bacterium]
MIEDNGYDITEEQADEPGEKGTENKKDKKDKKKMFITELLDWVRLLSIALVLTLLVRTFVFMPVIVDGGSMLPNLHDRELMFVTRFVRYIEPIDRGDVVILVPPALLQETGKYYVKRVIGLPGERIKIENGVVFINGGAIDEPYVAKEWSGSYPEVVIPADFYFVMGDNRNFSNDSRSASVGPIHKSKIEGRALAVMWPLSDIRSITTK